MKQDDEFASENHLDFADGLIEIFYPMLKQYGFKLLKLKITEYSSTLVWIKGNCYIDIGGNTHPHDAPFYYGISLGEYKGEYYNYSEFDSVGLYYLKIIQDNLDTVKETPFPLGKEIEQILIQTKNDLFNYGKDFLEGDLTKFYFARNKYRNE